MNEQEPNQHPVPLWRGCREIQFIEENQAFFPKTRNKMKEESCAMLKMIHASDFHLDGAYAGLTPQRAAARRKEQQELLDEFREIVTQREADLVLLAGDIFEGSNAYPETIDALIDCLGRLPCWVFITPGKHDYYSEKSPYALWKWPKNVHIFRDAATKAVTPPAVEGQPRVTIYGNAFTAPVRKRSPLEKFNPPMNWAGYHIMLSYGEVEQGNNLPDPEVSAPILKKEIANSGVHYLALGGMHNRISPQRAGRTYFTYAGSAQGRNFEELESKGVLYLELEITGEANMSFIPLGARQYHAVAVDITGQETLLDNLRRGLSERYPNRIRDIFRIILTGEASGPNLKTLTEGLEEEFYGLEIVDNSVLPKKVWTKKGEETITGMFLKEMEAIHPQTLENEDLDEETYQLALRLGMAALESREDFAL